MKAANFTFDLFNISLQYLQSGEWKLAWIGLLGFGLVSPKYLLYIQYDRYKTNPNSRVELQLFYLVLFKRNVFWIKDTDSYEVTTSGLFA